VSEFSRYPLDDRPVDAMSRAQLALILGLEDILREAGLVLTCPRCAADDHPQLATNNNIEDEVWKIDCQCRRRRVNRSNTAPMRATGDLLLLVPDLLKPLSLDVRCANPRCVSKALTIKQTRNDLIVECRCGTQRTFHKTSPQTKPH